MQCDQHHMFLMHEWQDIFESKLLTLENTRYSNNPMHQAVCFSYLSGIQLDAVEKLTSLRLLITPVGGWRWFGSAMFSKYHFTSNCGNTQIWGASVWHLFSGYRLGAIAAIRKEESILLTLARAPESKCKALFLFAQLFSTWCLQ